VRERSGSHEDKMGTYREKKRTGDVSVAQKISEQLRQEDEQQLKKARVNNRKTRHESKVP